MESNYSTWYSNSMGFDIEMLEFGSSGLPIILFPTSVGNYAQHLDSGMIDSISWFINEEKIHVYCIDSYASQNWYNSSILPHERALNYQRYETMVSKELIPRILDKTGQQRLGLAGCSYGGWNATNIAFKHPALISYLFSMSGMFDIKSQLDGYYDETVYFNNPVDFVPNLHDANLFKMGIVLGTGITDICYENNRQFSALLTQKGISHWLDIHTDGSHDWSFWRAVFPHYLSLL